MKKIFALLLALALLCSLTAAVFAEESYTITINAQGTEHIYEAYQVFAGELSSTDGKLSNVVWGSGVNGETLLTALQADAELNETFDDCTDAASVAVVLGELSKVNDEAKIRRFADLVNSKEVLTETKATSAPVENSTTQYTISVSQPGYYFIKDQDGSQKDHDAYTKFILQVVKSVEVKAKMAVPEIVKKIMDTNDTTEETSAWQDSADHDIGDDIPYQITATLADNVSDYDAYWVKITDTMSEGLTYNDDAKVFVDNVDKTSAFTITPVVGEDGVTVLTITCANVKALSAAEKIEIRVEYTCELNKDAVIGAKGNPNTVYMEYSNNPNEEFGGEANTAPEDIGKTPTDTVIAFTYQVVVDKVDENKVALTGAAFTLEKLTYGEAAEGEDPAEIWSPVGTATLNDAGTQFTFVGLDDGTYRLTETVTPEGYNTIDPIVFVVTADHNEEPDTLKLVDLSGDPITGEIKFTHANGALKTTVVNNSGTILPGTGGMGTTLFYIIGGLLLLGAVVVLVSKKRVDAE